MSTNPMPDPEISGNALILSAGNLDGTGAKTAHGLIRGTDRFRITGVIDTISAGKDAGEIIDGRHRNIPIYESIRAYRAAGNPPVSYLVLGVAFSGGRLPDSLRPMLLEAVNQGISVVNGLHQTLADAPDFQAACEQSGARVFDIRKPKPITEYHFWTGEIYSVKTPKIAVLGTDCAIGKRTTCRMLVETGRKNHLNAQMIFTGQTGWLQGVPYGFFFDATPNDFVCGELEHALVQCDRREKPDLIFIEGQSSLLNPFGPCGAEIIVSGNVKHVILQHIPFRRWYDGEEDPGMPLADIAREIDLIGAYGASVIAVTLNGAGGSPADLIREQRRLTERLSLPVILPLEEGVDRLFQIVRDIPNT